MALLAIGGFSLLMGTWTGLARAGVHDPVGPVGAHGIIMVLGFLGTLIALERAVAFGRPWGYLGPVLSGLSVVWLVAGGTAVVAGGMLVTAGTVVMAIYGTMLARTSTHHLALMAGGAVAWVSAAALWTVGWSAPRVTPVLAAFLVLTIVGERLELSRLRMPPPRVQRRLLVAAAVFAVGVALSLVVRPAGLAVGGAGLVLLAAWLARHDIARATVRRPGLPRFAAVCMLTGYVWLAVSGLLWLALAAGSGGPLIHDAAIHALFLGFVMSMVMGHAPIIVPAVLRATLTHRGVAWIPLVLLHLSVALRVGADVAGSVWLRGMAAHGNVTALLLFAGIAAWGVSRERPALASRSRGAAMIPTAGG